MVKSKLRLWSHGLILSIVIVHVAVCSRLFDGTQIWSYLTISVEAFFVLVSIQYVGTVRKLNTLERLSILYFLFLFFLTLIYGSDTSNIITLIGRSIEIGTVLMIVRLDKNNLTPFIICGTTTFSLCVYLNFYFLQLMPEGIPDSDGGVYYFLGTNYNQIGPKVLFAFIFCILLAKKHKIAMINAITIALLGLISVIIVGSMTSAVCLSLLLFVYLNSWSTKLNKLYLCGVLIFVVSFQIFIVFLGNTFNLSEAQRFLSFIGKDMTFTGRTNLWAYSADYFLDSPIWGHGYIDAEDFYNSGYFHGVRKTAHNYVYILLLKGGVILLIMAYNLFRLSFKQIKEYLEMRTAFTIVMATAVFFIMCLFEFYDTIYTYFLLIFMYYYQYFEKENRILTKLH